jgi:hypothetical protein
MSFNPQKVICFRCHNNPCNCDSPEEVHFSVADIDEREEVTLTDGLIKPISGGRRIEVWYVKDEPRSLAVRIFKPTNDGKMSKLFFGLTAEAAHALWEALSIQLAKMPPPSNQP